MYAKPPADYFAALARCSADEQDKLHRLFTYAANYRPETACGGISVHNATIAAHMRSSYDLNSFERLFRLLDDNGVFHFDVDAESGLKRTSGASENPDMFDRFWGTDTVVTDPSPRALLTLARSYNQLEERLAMEEAVSNPNWYRLGGLQNGVAHVFMCATGKRDPNWFNNKRLETHGRSLGAFCGLVSDEVSSRNLTESDITLLSEVIGGLAAYLLAINTDPATGAVSFAPTAGPWEEIPFESGLTGDMEHIRAGLEQLLKLIESDTALGAASVVRVMLKRHRFANFITVNAIKRFICEAQKQITERLIGGEHPMEHPCRPADAGLLFIATSTFEFDADVFEDAKHHFRVLDYLCHRLLREHGMIRYAPYTITTADGRKVRAWDPYLAANHWLPPVMRSYLNTGMIKSDCQSDGSGDCSDLEAYLSRLSMTRPYTEAQWCWTSVAAEGYILKTLAMIESTDGDLTPEQSAQVSQGIRASTYLINRSLARITGSGAVKANGHDCQSFGVPEAYEGVTCPDNGLVDYVPGVNSPLAWGQASLLSACRSFMRLLELAKDGGEVVRLV